MFKNLNLFIDKEKINYEYKLENDKIIMIML